VRSYRWRPYTTHNSHFTVASLLRITVHKANLNATASHVSNYDTCHQRKDLDHDEDSHYLGISPPSLYAGGMQGLPAAVAFRWVRSRQPLPDVVRNSNSRISELNGRSMGGGKADGSDNPCHHKERHYYSCKMLHLLLVPRCRGLWGLEPGGIRSWWGSVRNVESEEASFLLPCFYPTDDSLSSHLMKYGRGVIFWTKEWVGKR